MCPYHSGNISTKMRKEKPENLVVACLAVLVELHSVVLEVLSTGEGKEVDLTR